MKPWSYDGRPCEHKAGHYHTFPTGFTVWRCVWCYRAREKDRDAKRAAATTRKEPTNAR